MDYSLLKSIIELIEEFHEGSPSEKVEDFTIWLNNKLFATSKSDGHGSHDELLISFKIMLLNKQLKKQTKSVLANSQVSSTDEYSFLLHLAHQESFRKMELVELHNLEAPTGIEIIKRLLKKGLIEEFPDQEDKRAKRLKITEKGSAAVQMLEPEMNLTFSNFTESLNINEKVQLSGLLDNILK